MDTSPLSCEDLDWCFALRVLQLRPDDREEQKGSGREALQKKGRRQLWIRGRDPNIQAEMFILEAGSECVWRVLRAMLTQLMFL